MAALRNPEILQRKPVCRYEPTHTSDAIFEGCEVERRSPPLKPAWLPLVRESTKPASSATLKLAWQLFEFEVFFQQFIGGQGKKLNEIALQAGRANYRKSNSWHDQAAKCRTRE